MISIVIPVYNQSRYITEALDSVRAQTDPDWEAVVVDDGSTDDSRNVVQAYIEQHHDPRIRLVWPEKNGGVSAARNLGASQTRGDWLAFLDGDDAWYPNFAEVMGGHAASRDGVIGCGYSLMDGRSSPLPQKAGPVPSELAGFPACLLQRNFLQPSAAILSRKTFMRIGGFDTSEALQHVEDWDYWIRCLEQDIPFYWAAELIGCRYRQHSAAATRDQAKMGRRKLNLLKKHKNSRLFPPDVWGNACRRTSRTLAYDLARTAELGDAYKVLAGAWKESSPSLSITLDFARVTALALCSRLKSQPDNGQRVDKNPPGGKA